MGFDSKQWPHIGAIDILICQIPYKPQYIPGVGRWGMPLIGA